MNPNIKVFVKKVFLLNVLILCSITLSGCPRPTRVFDAPASLELHLLVCRDTSEFDARGLNIRWEGQLIRASSGTTDRGEELFSIGSSMHDPLSSSSPGRSIFRGSRRAENLRPGVWSIEVEYIFPNGTAADINARTELIAGIPSRIYVTHDSNDSSHADFPDCP